MIRQLIRVAILVSSQLVLVFLIHRCTETQSNGLKFKTLFSLFLAPLFLVLHFRAPAPVIHSRCCSHSSFTLSLGHPIHLFFIKLQRTPRLISCGSWWNREKAGSFPEAGRGRDRCQKSKAGGLVKIRMVKCPIIITSIGFSK